MFFLFFQRIATLQSYRANHNVENSEQYYIVTVFIPFIEHFMNQLELRLLKQKNLLSNIQNILPKTVVEINEKEINECINTILNQWPDFINANDNIVKKEALFWKQRWVDSDEQPNNFIDALNFCDKRIFPNIFNILKICATLPVTIATPERSFSTLKRIKTYLRNVTGQNRLNGLAHMSIHREVPLNVEEIIEKFAQKNRRLSLSEFHYNHYMQIKH